MNTLTKHELRIEELARVNGQHHNLVKKSVCLSVVSKIGLRMIKQSVVSDS